MSDTNFAGQQNFTDAIGQHNRISFLVEQTLAKTRTMQLVKIISSTNNGQISAPGFVNVQILVNQIDGAGNSTPHGTVFNIPVFRYQNGNSAIILDPQVGDVGWMAVADRDISSVKAGNGSQANPGSRRRFSLADGVYIGGLFGGKPSQYIVLNGNGIKIADIYGNIIEMKSGSIAITGNLTVTGSIISGFGGADQVNLQTHLHAGVQIGGGSTTAPTPGT